MRPLGCFKPAVLVLHWLLDGARVTQLADHDGNVRVITAPDGWPL
jgi:hypothetical protein